LLYGRAEGNNMETQNTQIKQKSFRVGLVAQAKLLASELYQETFDSINGSLNLYERIVDEAIPSYRWQVRKQMRANAAKLQDAKYTFEDNFCYYDNKGENQLILELPTKKEAEDDYGLAKFFGAKITPSLKYIVATNDQGKEVVAAIDGYGMHRDIVAHVEEITGSKLHGISGGRFSVDKSMFRQPKLTLYGSSQDFGEANHEQVAEILNKYGLEAKVRAEK
jgi:hypothetical protein